MKIIKQKELIQSYKDLQYKTTINKKFKKTPIENKTYTLQDAIPLMLGTERVVYIHNDELERYEFYKLVESEHMIGELGKTEVKYDTLLVWVVEKINNPKLYNFLSVRLQPKLNKKTGNIEIMNSNIYASGYSNLRVESSRFNYNFKEYVYSNQFIDIMENYNQCFDLWIQEFSNPNLIGENRAVIINRMYDKVIEYFYQYTGGGYMRFSLKSNVFDFINAESFNKVLDALTWWLWESGLRMKSNKDKVWTKQDIYNMKFIITKMKELLMKVMNKIELSDSEIRQYDSIAKIISSGISIYDILECINEKE